jgi:hypothetical protein
MAAQLRSCESANLTTHCHACLCSPAANNDEIPDLLARHGGVHERVRILDCADVDWQLVRWQWHRAERHRVRYRKVQCRSLPAVPTVRHESSL